MGRTCRILHTLGVCDLTLPARASEPWTLPMIAGQRFGVEFENVRVCRLCGEVEY